MANSTERAVGRSVARKDGIGKATGKAIYADDLVFPGMLWGRTVRSEIPRGRVRSIRRDFDEAGFTVIDYRDIPGKNVIALIELDQPCLVEREIRRATHPCWTPSSPTWCSSTFGSRRATSTARSRPRTS
jgi:xanthine dehydrogenase molybdopterin-binding subunit B